MIPALSSGSLAIAAFAQTLLHSFWQCLVLAAALWLVLRLLPRASSSLRYGACCAALCAMPVASVLTFCWLLAAPRAIEAMAAQAAGSHFDLGLALSCAWALGCATMLLRLGLGVTHLGRMVKRARPIEPQWQAQVDALALRLGLSRHVAL
ncbi:MAG: hypothetical protein ABW217_17855, partial [Polyangiaceae bacterium]